MIFLSRLTLNLRNERARRELEDVYELHRTLMTAFPDREEGGPGRILFRVEGEGLKPYGRTVLVQSGVEPDWSRLNVDEDYLLNPPEHKSFDPLFSQGDVFSFRILANPTVKREGKRLGLMKDEEQIEWMKRKAENNGFSLISLVNIPKGGREGHKASENNKLKFHSVLFEGVLVVEDPEMFRNVLESGIGSGKGFGFGMLSLAKG